MFGESAIMSRILEGTLRPAIERTVSAQISNAIRGNFGALCTLNPKP